MSQFIFQAGKDTECQVGWDHPLETFYGQVYKVDEEGRVDVYEGEDGEEMDGTIHWVGTSPKEIKTVEDLEQRLKPHVQILPGDVFKKLKLILVDQEPMEIEDRPAGSLIQSKPPE